jgi:hypothetical protein
MYRNTEWKINQRVFKINCKLYMEDWGKVHISRKREISRVLTCYSDGEGEGSFKGEPSFIVGRNFA